MHVNDPSRLRSRLAVATTAVLALAITGLSSSPTATSAAPPPPAFESQSGDREEFPGYTGYVGENDFAGAPATDGNNKPHDPTLADPSEARGEDVPGQATSPAGETLEKDTRLATGSTRAPDVRTIRAAIARAGSARVNVVTGVRPDLEAHLTRPQVRSQRSAIAASLRQLDAGLAGTGSRLVSRLRTVPTATYQIDGRGLSALLADESVEAVSLDGYAQLTLDVSTGVIDSDLLNAAGVRGNNFEGSPGFYEVAILDSGVDNQHSAFAGRIHDQACFSVGSDCPNGGTSQIGGNAGDNCTYTPATRHCEHGTHVAGIAAGADTTGGHEGVADGSRIVAVQIGSEGGGAWSAAFSDINTGLQHVLNLRNGGHRIVAVNMSIGITGFAQNSSCDANNATFQTTQNLAAQLQAAGVAVIASAGNDNLVGASYPACLSSVHSISASNDSDAVAGFTNAGTTTDWWAPGVGIHAPIPPGPTTYDFNSGTSMAAPHVAGAWALMRECVDANGVPISNGAVVNRFNATGVDITDNGATRKRINVLDAATGTVNNNDFAAAETLPANPGAGFDDFDFTVCSDTEPGEPGPFSLDNGVWWTWTPSATGTATISTEDDGGNATTFDTTLAAYTGNTLGTLQTIAFDDDAGTGSRSLVTFPVNGGTTYRIKVDGFGAANGLLNLHVENGPPPTCFGVAATIVGTSVADTLTGTAGDDVIVTGAGADTVSAGEGDDRICGDAGDDTISGGPGGDLVLGGSGADTIRGGGGDDTLVGNPGGASNDDGGDLILGGPGTDFLDGWFGDDTLDGGAGNDALRGEAGNDTVTYSSATGGVSANLSTSAATGAAGDDTFNEVENLTGSPFRDTLIGAADSNVLRGAADADHVRGMAGNDVLRGSGGNDRVRGHGGRDRLAGNAGKDALDGGPQRDRCAGGPGTDSASSCERRTGIP